MTKNSLLQVKLLAQNVTSFTKTYSPHDHPRILKYLKTRSLRQVILPSFTGPVAKGGQGKAKRQKVPNQRMWSYMQEPATSLVSPGPYQPKGKGKPKGKGQPKGKGKGKPSSKGKAKGKPKGKGKGLAKGKGNLQPKGVPLLASPRSRLKPVNLITVI